jgi:hypothetical protein
VFWFLFWFGLWFEPNSNDVTKPMEKRIPHDFIEEFQGNEMVREAGVEPTTFGSGGENDGKINLH